MSYALAVDSLAARIAALTPEFDADRPFFGIETASGGGSGVDLESAHGVTRAFDIRMAGLPSDDGGSGFVITRWSVAIEVRVRYEWTTDRDRLERAMAADACQLATAIVHPSLPLPWHASIDTVIAGAPSAAVIQGPERTPAGVIVTLPATMAFTYTPEIGS